jgi:hypothetical protein
MATIRTSVEAQSRALSEAAAEIMAQPRVAERRYVPLSSADAVLLYAADFIPSWAGAIAIDLLPAVLVGVMCVVHASMRRGEDDLEDADRITAADMRRALDLHDSLLAKRQLAAEVEPHPAIPDQQPAEARPAAENVTPIALGDRKRGDP